MTAGTFSKAKTGNLRNIWSGAVVVANVRSGMGMSAARPRWFIATISSSAAMDGMTG
jgi:hypothetical protein